MKVFPVNRCCPITGEFRSDLLGYVSAAQAASGNKTYRNNFAAILGINPEDRFPIVRSAVSRCIFAGWDPPTEFLSKVYEDAIDHTASITGSLPYHAMQCRFASVVCDAMAKVIAATKRPVKVLDYGCGYGTVLRLLSCRETKCFGFEPSLARTKEASFTGALISDDLKRLAASGPFDAFICTEVLEHLSDPLEALSFMRENATPGALLAVTVPNCEPQWIKNWLAIARNPSADVPKVINPWEHLNYFSSTTLRQLLRRAGFHVMCDIGPHLSETSLVPCTGMMRYKSIIGATKRFWQSNLSSSTQFVCRLSC